MDYNQIGSRIKELRIKHNLKQADFGKIFGVSTQAVSKWEHGGIPDIEVLLAIADKFNVSMDELCGRSAFQEDKLDQLLYNSVSSMPEAERMALACRYCWAIFKGTTGMGAINDINYSSLEAATTESTRCRCNHNDGIAYFLACSDAQLMALMPEPKNGFSSILGNVSQCTSLFRFLSDPEVFRLFLFICTRKKQLFSMSWAARENHISEEKTQQVFQIFEKYGWLAKENVEMEDGKVSLYRPDHKEYFLFFLFFAQELMTNPRFLYIGSVTSRTKPLFSEDILHHPPGAPKSGEPKAEK